MHSNDSFPLCLHRHMHAKKIGFHEKAGLSMLWGNVLWIFFIARMDHVCLLVKAPLALLNSTHRLKPEL